MQTDSIKLTDSLERELIRREIEAVRGIDFAGIASGSLRHFLRAGTALGAAIDLLRSQARIAKVDYASG